jgi:hypothetical protein
MCTDAQLLIYELMTMNCQPRTDRAHESGDIIYDADVAAPLEFSGQPFG